MSSFLHFFNSVVAGFFACLSSVCGKMMSDSSSWMVFVMYFVLNIALTAFAIVFQTRALRHLSTLSATATNLASNFIFTSVFGMLVFGEILTLRWYIGYAVIMFGLTMIMRGD
ncbi:hypothetical protein C9374_006201 [Naegleria lovaniensis]|uniref:EamA domain-containing protein n=1 Tax=Naegleria lovaniensis TaxID=51637 RepID=A0AA88GP47_NAELO|nr:uncharacterized protein C9374_006201 [Naegleria lovaniensis]KAG2381817.1 hypothetical protein C9374_006201 [Naegleria lovaniensis]